MKRFLAQLARHQAAAFAASALDMLVMVALVEIAAIAPAGAAFAGAICGGLANFVLGRIWAFRADGPLAGQAIRYALVSGASACWNALGEWLATHELGLNYVAARVGVSLIVGIGWNFPAQRSFVFRAREAVPRSEHGP